MTLAKHPAIRSKKILNHAKGQQCTLRFDDCCNHNSETVVAAHIRDRHKGMGTKASDFSIVFACSDCHRYLDEYGDKLGRLFPHEDVMRAFQETLEILIRDGIIVIPQDLPPRPKRTKPRKLKGQRAPLRSRKEFGPGRPMQSRNDFRKATP